MSSGLKDTRTWTDEQLRSAIASEQTWKAVAHALGLAQSSTPRLRQHARRLDLDISHFTGKRRWSDIDLRLAIGESFTWADVLQRLDISDTTETRMRVKAHAIRLGIDVARLNSQARIDRPVLGPADLSADLLQLRTAAESIAIAWFTLRGVPVAVPVQAGTSDLLVTLPEGIRRVQVKSTTCRTKTGTWQVGVGHRPYSLDKSARAAPYDPDEVDYFWVIVGDGAIYLIPSYALAGRTNVYIRRYARYWVGDASSLLVSAGPESSKGRVAVGEAG